MGRDRFLPRKKKHIIGDLYDISSPVPLGATNLEVGKKKVPLVELLNCNFYAHIGVSHDKTFRAGKTFCSLKQIMVEIHPK